MANPTVKLSADEKEVLAALDNIERAEDGLAKKFDQVGDAGEQAAGDIEKAFKRSNGKTLDEFELLLRELRKTGPEGGKQARAIEAHLRSTGQRGRQSIESIIDKIGEMDEAAADAARNADTSFDKFGENAIVKIGSIAAGFLSVGSAVQTVNKFLEEQSKLLEDARQAQSNLAVSQADAAKNLIGLSEIQRSELLKDAVQSIAGETGFADLAGLTTAIGAARSAGGTVEQTVSAVRAAAGLTQLTPQSIDEYAGAGIDLARSTGIDDARQNLGLLLSTGTQSRVVDPIALAKELAPSVNNAVAQTVGQNPVEASREAAALFATFTQAATDITGAPSRTATIQFSSELGKFFSGLEDERVKARSSIQTLENKKSPTEKDFADVKRLNAFLDASEGMKDSGSLFGRLSSLQGSQGLREQFYSKDFGEAQFKNAFRQLGEAGTDASKMIVAAKDAIKADVGVYQAEVASEGILTPQLKLGMLEARSRTNLALGQQGATEGAKLAQVRSIVDETLTQSRALSSFPEWIGEYFFEHAGIKKGTLKGGTAAEEAVQGLQLIQSKSAWLLGDGLTGDERSAFSSMQGQEKLLQDLIVSEINSGLPSGASSALRGRLQESVSEQQRRIKDRLVNDQPEQAALLQKNVEALESMIQLLDSISRNTAPNSRPVAPPVNYGSGLQTAADSAARP